MQEGEESRCHLQIYMRLGNELIAYLTHLRKACVWIWMKKHSYTSEEALPIHSLLKLLIWYALANAASLIAMPLPPAWTWLPTCVRSAHGSWLRGTTLLPARATATAPVRGLQHVCRHGQATESAGSARLEPAGNPSHAACAASVIPLIQQPQCCPE